MLAGAVGPTDGAQRDFRECAALAERSANVSIRINLSGEEISTPEVERLQRQNIERAIALNFGSFTRQLAELIEEARAETALS